MCTDDDVTFVEDTTIELMNPNAEQAGSHPAAPGGGELATLQGPSRSLGFRCAAGVPTAPDLGLQGHTATKGGRRGVIAPVGSPVLDATGAY
jgi:hypothetical protein